MFEFFTGLVAGFFVSFIFAAPRLIEYLNKRRLKDKEDRIDTTAELIEEMKLAFEELKADIKGKKK